MMLRKAMSSSFRRLAPSVKRRGFIALPQGEAAPVIGGIIGANVAVYAGWQTLDPRTMTRHFTLCADDVLKRPHTLFTGFFSHRDGWHLLGNMMTLFFFGPEVIYAIGARSFLGLFFGAGSVSSLCEIGSDLSKNSYWKKPRYLGASGAVNACVTWSILLNPWRLIFVFAEMIPLPLPAILYGGAYVSKDLAALFNVRIPYISDRAAPGVAHGAHVAGAALGAIHFFLFRYRPFGGGRFRRF